MKENLKNVSHSHVYRIILINIHDVDDRHVLFYRDNRQYKTWKHNRKTQYKNGRRNNLYE